MYEHLAKVQLHELNAVTVHVADKTFLVSDFWTPDFFTQSVPSNVWKIDSIWFVAFLPYNLHLLPWLSLMMPHGFLTPFSSAVNSLLALENFNISHIILKLHAFSEKNGEQMKSNIEFIRLSKCRLVCLNYNACSVILMWWMIRLDAWLL